MLPCERNGLKGCDSCAYKGTEVCLKCDLSSCPVSPAKSKNNGHCGACSWFPAEELPHYKCEVNGKRMCDSCELGKDNKMLTSKCRDCIKNSDLDCPYINLDAINKKHWCKNCGWR